MISAYLSYTHQDRHHARFITESLRRAGIKVYSDIDTLVLGTDFSQQVIESIKKADIIIILLSEHSKQSHWPSEEFQNTLLSKDAIIPIVIDAKGKDNRLWPLLSKWRAINYQNSLYQGEDGLSKFIADLILACKNSSKIAKKANSSNSKSIKQFSLSATTTIAVVSLLSGLLTKDIIVNMANKIITLIK